MWVRSLKELSRPYERDVVSSDVEFKIYTTGLMCWTPGICRQVHLGQGSRRSAIVTQALSEQSAVAPNQPPLPSFFQSVESKCAGKAVGESFSLLVIPVAGLKHALSKTRPGHLDDDILWAPDRHLPQDRGDD